MKLTLEETLVLYFVIGSSINSYVLRIYIKEDVDRKCVSDCTESHEKKLCKSKI